MPPRESDLAPTTVRDSRVLVFSQRNIARPTWQALQYEFEDLLTTFDDVRLVSPQGQRAPTTSSLSRRVVNGTKHRLGVPRRSPIWVAPSMRPTSITTSHELFFAVFHFPHQLSHLERLHGWRERSRYAVCVLMELWGPDVRRQADYLRLLSQFDAVFVWNPNVLGSLTGLGLDRPLSMVPAVDAIRASPQPHLPSRVLDVYNYGRTAPSPHTALMRLVEEQGLTYLYETRGDATVEDHQAHRALVANMMKRSKYFMAYRVNDSPERQDRTGGDEVLSTRYFEGVAGGAVLLGSRTLSEEFDRTFDWPDAVVPVPYDETDMRGVLQDLAREPDRLAAARTANVRNSLLRHDWSARWSQVLESVDLAPTQEVLARRARLSALADTVDLPPDVLVLDGDRV
jgi:hypothetical protein